MNSTTNSRNDPHCRESASLKFCQKELLPRLGCPVYTCPGKGNMLPWAFRWKTRLLMPSGCHIGCRAFSRISACPHYRAGGEGTGTTHAQLIYPEVCQVFRGKHATQAAQASPTAGLGASTLQSILKLWLAEEQTCRKEWTPTLLRRMSHAA